MWQELVGQVGIVWVILVLIVTAVLLAMSLVYALIVKKLIELNLGQYGDLLRDMNNIEGCRIENLPAVSDLVASKMNREFDERFGRLAVDSKNMFQDVWIPLPANRLFFQDVLPGSMRQALNQSMPSAVLLAGIAAAALALSSGYSIYGSMLNTEFMRLVAVLPFIFGALGFLIMRQMRLMYMEKLKAAWENAMVEFERKLPVFNQAAETAALLHEIKAYDLRMSESAQVMSDQVRRLASGQLTEAVSNAVKYVMAANVAPAIMKSTDALSLLAQKIEKQVEQTDSTVVKLYTELEHRQRQQAEVWLKRNQEMTETFTVKQKEYLDHLQKSEQQLVDTLTTAQKHSLDEMTSEQHKTLQEMNKLNQSSWQILQEKLGAILKQLSEGQTRLIENLDKGQQETLEKMCGEQRKSLDEISDLQQTSLKQLAGQQEELLGKVEQRQEVILEKIMERQMAALENMGTVQSESLAGFRQHQETVMETMSSRQKEALEELSQNFSGQVSESLGQHLDPLTKRLSAASESLIAAQEYASSVREALQLQHEQSSALQESIRDLFEQLIETRKAMTEDLTSLRKSSAVMSEASEAMSSVYAGSQEGLSEAISQMSQDLMRLSDVLSTVMEGSAEQTRLIQTQSLEVYETNQKHLDAVREQITVLSDELSTRIDQLMLGFSHMTEELVKNLDETIKSQNENLGGSLRNLTEIMGDEARSMSLFAQQINMDVEQLNENLGSAVKEFDNGMRQELSSVLTQFDKEVSDVVKRLARSAVELSDAVEALPEALRKISQEGEGKS